MSGKKQLKLDDYVFKNKPESSVSGHARERTALEEFHPPASKKVNSSLDERFSKKDIPEKHYLNNYENPLAGNSSGSKENVDKNGAEILSSTARNIDPNFANISDESSSESEDAKDTKDLLKERKF